MREDEPSPNASPPLEELRSSPSPRKGKRSCSRCTSHRRASWLPMRELREPFSSRRRGTREREPSLWLPLPLLNITFILNITINLKSKFYRFDKEGNRWKERTASSIKFPKNKVTSKVESSTKGSYDKINKISPKKTPTHSSDFFFISSSSKSNSASKSSTHFLNYQPLEEEKLQLISTTKAPGNKKGDRSSSSSSSGCIFTQYLPMQQDAEPTGKHIEQLTKVIVHSIEGTIQPIDEVVQSIYEEDIPNESNQANPIQIQVLVANLSPS
ncbi:hypothetical protein Ahy_B01g056505 [Arachis hypogaea]|uniref:Uncharacterized protein n=1 Tax=Arachis hypogaea TaxID=3818 RepID=A0A445AYY6_ARAHY|nr:hypothetical protein Ahy_B01g056505 [Arachis hypogaea]